MTAKEEDFENTRRPFDLNEMALAVKLHKNSGCIKTHMLCIQKMPMPFEALIYSSSALLDGGI